MSKSKDPLAKSANAQCQNALNDFYERVGFSHKEAFQICEDTTLPPTIRIAIRSIARNLDRALSEVQTYVKYSR